MAPQSCNAFTKALDRFRGTLTDEQKKSFSASSLNDVEGEIIRIQASCGQRKELRNMNRLAKFLEGMQQIEELVTVFLNVHEAVAFIWGPIKFVLNIAKNRLESFEVLLDTYVEIGDAIPRLRQYEQIFKDYASGREVLERCFYDILEFHKAALDMFKRTRWEKYFDYTWKTFKTRFRPILDSLKRNRDLLMNEELTAAILEAQASRGEAREGRDEARACHLIVETKLAELSRQMNEIVEEAREKEARNLQESLIQRRRFISSQLAAGNYEADQQSAFLQCSSSPSEDWVLRDERFKEWLQPKHDTSSLLYLHGMPGAGKTILVSRIVNHLQSQIASVKGPVLFFYFKSFEEDKRSMSYMIRALLDQLIYQDDSLVDLLYPKCCSLSDARLRTLSTLKELLEDCILAPRGCTIILDGLDECQDEQQNNREGPKLIIDWINDLLIPELLDKGTNVRFLLSSQHVDFLEKELSRHPSIRLDQHVGHLRNIQAYTQSKACAIETRFRLSKTDADALVQKVSAASLGFFLYAKVVLKNLMDQGSKREFERELVAENFPQNLDQAYERVVVRILDRGSQSNRDSALKIFGWMICAFRPLCWSEIQSRFCIDPEQGSCDFENHREDSYRQLCGSLIDEEEVHEISKEAPYTVVKFVHNTAGKYLIHTGRLSLIDQHVDTAILCSRYLVSRPLHKELQHEAIEEFAISGYYGFLDYIVAFWIPHLSCALDDLSSVSSGTASDLLCAAARTFQSFSASESSSSFSYRRTFQDVHAMLDNWCEKGSKCHLEKLVLAIREVIESICVSELAESDRTNFLRLNGSPSFKCPKSDCHNFTMGFLNSENRESHLNNHERPFKCLVPGCYFEIVGLRSELELKTHSKFQHPDPSLPPLFPKSKLKSAPKKKVDIFEACTKGDLDLVQTYIDLGGDVNKRHPSQPELTPLIMAARHGQTLACGLLIDNGATQIFLKREKDSHAKRNLLKSTAAILEAMQQENHALFRYLMHKASEQQKEEFILSERFRPYLEKAMNLRDGQIFKCFLSLFGPTSRPKRHMYPDSDQLLHLIISEITSVSKLEIALEWLSPITARSYSHMPLTSTEVQYRRLTTSFGSTGDTILHIACKYVNLPIVRFLLRRLRQEDIKKVNYQGQTALEHTLLADVTELLELFFDSDDGAYANGEDQNGRLPIHSACSKNHKRRVELLTKYTRDLNAEDSQGKTPLIIAVDSENIELVRILLKTERVDILRHNRLGDTAVDHVPRLKRPFDMLRLLKQHNSSILNNDSVTTYLESFLEDCIFCSRLAKLELFLELHPTWLIRQLLETDRVAIAKECLSVETGIVPANQMLDVWDLVEDETDAELRALVLLQGHLPQNVWLGQLPDLKDLLEQYSTPKYLLRLLTADSEVQETLLYQAGSQNDERLRNLVLRCGIS